jgi:hypothetical protein
MPLKSDILYFPALEALTTVVPGRVHDSHHEYIADVLIGRSPAKKPPPFFYSRI